VNANHVRPLLAFWALAVAAAIITGTGLRAQSRDVTVSAGRPAPVRTSGTPEVVLGGLLRAETAHVLGNPLAPDLWGSLAYGTPKAGTVQVAAPSKRPRARSHATAHAQPVTVPTDSSGVTKALDNPTPKPHKDPPGKSKDTATATVTATATPTGAGHGKGKGSGDHTGRGQAH